MIATKAQNYELYHLGAYGNKLRTWNSLEELYRSGYQGPVTLRYQEPQSPFCRYYVPFEELPEVLREMEGKGARRELISFNESAPDDHLLIQGEVMASPKHYTLFYSREKLPMRQALRRAHQAEGLEALRLLRDHLAPSSYEDLQELLDLYPGCIIEFSAYSQDLGWARSRNTIFWEVRAY